MAESGLMPPRSAPAGSMPGRTRNPELDHLRAYAVLVVVARHLALILAPGPSVLAFFSGVYDASGGVDLFFAISGYVISASLEPLWALERSSRPAPWGFVTTFFVKRFWRLWPASTLWITCCLASSWIWAGRGGWPPVEHVAREWVTALVPVYELQEFRDPGVLGYFWTLSVEWQFYALFPLLLTGLRSAGGRAAALALLFGIGLCTNEISWMLRFCSIIGGIGIHALHRSGRLSAGGPMTRRRWLGLWLTPLLLIVLVTVPQLGHSMLVGQLGLTALCSILVAMAAARRGLIGDCGLPKALGWIGLRSYSLYLCHIPVALTLSAAMDLIGHDSATDPAWLATLLIGLALVISLALADLSYRWIELALQRRYRPRPVC